MYSTTADVTSYGVDGKKEAYSKSSDNRMFSKEVAISI
jgi:hypothetical protein